MSIPSVIKQTKVFKFFSANGELNEGNIMEFLASRRVQFLADTWF